MTTESDIRLLLNRAANNLAAIDQIAAHMLQKGMPLKPVLQAYKTFLSHHPTSASAAFNNAFYLSRDGQFEAAIEMYKRALRSKIEGPEEVHLNIANIYMDHLRQAGLAKRHLEKSLELQPAYASAYYNLGNLSEQSGDREKAQRCFEQCLQLAPGNESALARLADAHRFDSLDDPMLARLKQTAVSSINSDVHFALGRTYEQLGQYDLAWQHFSKANSLDERSLPAYRPDQAEAIFSRISTQCDSNWLKRFPGASDENVFICGMFRTGSTLLEQIFAAHPSFTAGGESEFFPRLVKKSLAGFPEGLAEISPAKVKAWRSRHKQHLRRLFSGSIRVTDKRPDNFLHIGLIKAVVPSAKFVVTERDWRDVATSVFGTRFGAGQNYSTNLIHIRHYLDLQKSLIDHWQNVLGADLIRVNYEDLVLRPRETIGDILKQLGEDWDEACLSFNQLTNAVQTASVWQVREPLHTKSVGRWKHFQAFFEEAFGAEVSA